MTTSTARPTVLYITSSSYSGSTLLAFLLNTHPDIFTVSEMNGWHYAEGEVFNCSCGSPLASCPLFQRIGDACRVNGLPFHPRDFGTEYVLARNERLNRYLTGGLPAVMTSTRLERLRDGLVRRLGACRRRLALIDRTNLVFIRTALEWSGARIFVDACKDPFRLRHLQRITDLRVVHLVRDIHGVVLSNLEMKRPGWTAALAAKRWIHEQATILRVLQDFAPTMTVHYEAMCSSVNQVVASIHRFAGVLPRPVPDDFKSVEHHILGNVMRLSAVRAVVNSERWRRDLAPADVDAVQSVARSFLARNRDHPVSALLRSYVATEPDGRPATGLRGVSGSQC